MLSNSSTTAGVDSPATAESSTRNWPRPETAWCMERCSRPTPVRVSDKKSKDVDHPDDIGVLIATIDPEVYRAWNRGE